MQIRFFRIKSCDLDFCIFLFFTRYLTEKVVPGNRVTVMGIYSIKKVAQKNDKVGCFKVKGH